MGYLQVTEEDLNRAEELRVKQEKLKSEIINKENLEE